MTGRVGTKGKNRRRMAVLGGAVGAFAAAAAMATDAAVTGAPAPFPWPKTRDIARASARSETTDAAPWALTWPS